MDKPWQQHYTDTVPATLQYPKIPIDVMLRNTALEYPRNTALIFGGARIYYRELDLLVDKFSRGLFDLGVRKGDRVALLMPNCPQMIIAFYALFRMGAIAVPINPLYQEREIAYQVENSGAETLIALDILYPRISAISAQTHLKRCVMTSIKDFLPPLKKMLYPLFQMKESHRVTKRGDMHHVEFKNFMEFKKEGDSWFGTYIQVSAAQKRWGYKVGETVIRGKFEKEHFLFDHF